MFRGTELKQGFMTLSIFLALKGQLTAYMLEYRYHPYTTNTPLLIGRGTILKMYRVSVISQVICNLKLFKPLFRSIPIL